MAIPLYDLSVKTFQQVLTGVSGFLEKGLTHCKANNIDLLELVEFRLAPDMLPFRFQVVAVAHHSRCAMAGAQAGVFKPPAGPMDQDYAGLQKLVAEARAEIDALTPAAVNALEGKDVVFQMGDFKMPFVAEGFLMSFSLPNLYFHATTAYDILRLKGVPLGKRDYMGPPRLKK
jgi:hypothetical protein